jgi:hypothetical protein
MFLHATKTHSISAILVVCAVALISVAAGASGFLLLRSDAQPPAATAQDTAGSFDATSFDEFPLLSLGDEFEGLPLTHVVHQVGGPSGDQQMITFIYGDCVMKNPDTPCPAPLQVTNYSSCGPDIASQTLRDQIEVRGVATRHYGPHGHLFLKTQSSKAIIISSALDNEDQAVRAARALVGHNTLAKALRKQDRLDKTVGKGKAC